MNISTITIEPTSTFSKYSIVKAPASALNLKFPLYRQDEAAALVCDLKHLCRTIPRQYSEAFLTMIASEDILRRDWDTPEEDAAWSDL